MSTSTPANCSGLAYLGVPAKPPGYEIVVPESCPPTCLAKPRSMIFAIIVPVSYSLGVILWEMVTGQTLLSGSPAEVMIQHQHPSLPLVLLIGLP